jgi:hypothetical protein
MARLENMPLKKFLNMYFLAKNMFSKHDLTHFSQPYFLSLFLYFSKHTLV